MDKKRRELMRETIFKQITHRLKYLRNARIVQRHYLRWPYPVNIAKESSFDSGFAHEHICFAARFANVDLSILCPLDKQNGFCPGSDEDCENCRYFGTVSYIRSADTGEPQLHFDMDPDVVHLVRWKDLGKNDG